jgi:hypothetical protein
LLTSRLQSTYLGGNGDDASIALAIHPTSGQVYVTGSTKSTDYPKVTGSEQTLHAVDSASYDAFVSRLSFDLLAADAVPNALSFAAKLNVPMGSLQLSAPAQISGIVGSVPVSLAGGNFAQYCISSASNCTCDVRAFDNIAATINNAQYVCLRQNAPFSSPALAKATLVVGGAWANFLVTTGSEIGAACSLDVDGNGGIDALTDGFLLMRAMFGLTGTSVTNGAVGVGASRMTWAQLQPYLNGNCGTSFAP